MTLLALSYPTLAPRHHAWIEQIHQQHDAQFGMVAPHFTLVFPTADHAAQPFCQHIRRQLQGQPPIAFNLRCAMVVKDVLSGLTHTFLVPDQGFSDLVKLHDKLYGGLLAPQLRLDVPYIPHITVASARDAAVCKRVTDEINAAAITVAGTIRLIDVVQFVEGTVTTIEQITLS